MSDILVRDVPDLLRRELQKRARQHGHSMSKEAAEMMKLGIELAAKQELSKSESPGLGTLLAELGAHLEPGDWSDDMIPARNEPDRPPPDFS